MPLDDDPRYPGPRVQPSTHWCECRHAALLGNVEVLEKAVAAGWDVNEAAQRGGDTVLGQACYSGQAKFVKALLDAKADPNKVTNDWNNTALMAAASHACSVEICEMLLDAGAKDKTDKNGRTAWAYISKDPKPKNQPVIDFFRSRGLAIDIDLDAANEARSLAG